MALNETLSKELKEVKEKREHLKNLDLFVLDNTLRETTVGQLRGHTLEDKWEIYEQVKRVGFNNVIVASFSHMTRLGDTFINQMYDKGEDMSNKFAFSELSDNVNNGIPVDDLPVGLQKCFELGISNPIIEMDLVYYMYDYNKFTHEKYTALIDKRIQWIRNNISEDAKILFNLRDFSDCMAKQPQRLMDMVTYLASYRPPIFAIVYEESGVNFPEELGVYTSLVKKEMNRCQFPGHLLVHVHHQWGLSDMIALECLANGATGIWAGLCDEGAAMGHASSCLTMMNLIRMGNEKILKKFNCTELRKAAIKCTEIVTDHKPHPKAAVVGERALDQVFGLPQFDATQAEGLKGSFNLAEFVGRPSVMRMSTLADNAMIRTHLITTFGENDQFTLVVGTKMKELMLEDLRGERKEEYQSPVGLALLFDRAGGKMSAIMSDVIVKFKSTNLHINSLIAEIKSKWDEWDMRDGKQDDFLEFDAFYNGFMGSYFGCYRCHETKLALKAIDMDADGKVDWKEFAVYLKWAGNAYPDTKTSQELLDKAFREGLLPAMQDSLVQIAKQA